MLRLTPAALLVLVLGGVRSRRRRLPFPWMRELAGAGFRVVTERDGRLSMAGGTPEVKVAWSTTRMVPLLRVHVPLARPFRQRFHASLGRGPGRAIGPWSVVTPTDDAAVLEGPLSVPALAAWAQAHPRATVSIVEDAVLFGRRRRREPRDAGDGDRRGANARRRGRGGVRAIALTETRAGHTPGGMWPVGRRRRGVRFRAR